MFVDFRGDSIDPRSFTILQTLDCFDDIFESWRSASQCLVFRFGILSITVLSMCGSLLSNDLKCSNHRLLNSFGSFKS